MTSTIDLIITILILLAAITVPILLIRRHSKKQAQKRRSSFKSHCSEAGLQIEYLMERKDRICALDTQNKKIAWANLDNDSKQKPSILSFEPTKKQILHIIKDGKLTQKIMLRPVYKTKPKGVAEIIFYNSLYDDTLQLETYLQEAQVWEKAILSIRDIS